MFDFQVSLVNRSQGLKTKKKEPSRIFCLLVAAQCNCIAACAYSLKIFTVQYMHYYTYLTVWYVVLRPLFIFLFDKRAQNAPV